MGNLFLDDQMILKIGDFGLAYQHESMNERRNAICGTPNYVAPEIIKGSSEGYSFEVDVWSLGVIIYKMIIGINPFSGDTIQETYQRIKDNDYDFPDDLNISYAAEDLIRRILVQNPKKRLTLKQIEYHPFLNSIGTIPKTLCPTLINNPPSLEYIKYYEEMVKEP